MADVKGFYLKPFMEKEAPFDAFSVVYNEDEQRVNIKMLGVFGDETVAFNTLSLPLEAARCLANEIQKIEPRELKNESQRTN